MIPLMLLGTAFADEPTRPVRPPPPPPPKTLQDYVDRSQLVLHVRVDHLEPFDLEELPFGLTATEIHLVILEAFKGAAPDNDVWIPFPDRFAENWRPMSTVGTEMLIFAVSSAGSKPASAHAVSVPYSGAILRGPAGVLTYADGSSTVYLVGFNHMMAAGLASFGEAPVTWPVLLAETRGAVARSTATNAFVVGPER